MMLRFMTLLEASGSTDIIRVYRNQIVIRIAKLKPYVARSL
jgi:hypothetical protein